MGAGLSEGLPKIASLYTFSFARQADVREASSFDREYLCRNGLICARHSHTRHEPLQAVRATLQTLSSLSSDGLLTQRLPLPVALTAFRSLAARAKSPSAVSDMMGHRREEVLIMTPREQKAAQRAPRAF